MCDNCFTSERNSFPDEDAWTSFDLELTKKLGQGMMKNIKFVPEGQRDIYIYQCLMCGEKWKMKHPDNAFRGYFLKLSMIEKVTTRLSAWQIVFIGIIVIKVIYGWLTNKD